MDKAAIAKAVQPLLTSRKLAIFGGLYHVTDGMPLRQELDFSQADYEQRLIANLQADRALGCEYITFQLHLPPKVSVPAPYGSILDGLTSRIAL